MYTVMLVLVSGGAASGKSELAEGLAVSCGGEKIYIATMLVRDSETRGRVNRHREMRRGKGFETIECPRDLSSVKIPEGSTVLLECMSNLTANECFGDLGFAGAEERVFEGIRHIERYAENIIIVTNEIFSDGARYSSETLRYMENLAGLNRAIAVKADIVAEVVCGIPVYWKGEAG